MVYFYQCDARRIVLASVRFATGFLVAAVHHPGLAALTHTPSPMAFLNRILNRPAYDKPFLLLVVGHPTEDAKVPDIHRKPLDAISTFMRSKIGEWVCSVDSNDTTVLLSRRHCDGSSHSAGFVDRLFVFGACFRVRDNAGTSLKVRYAFFENC